MSRELNFQGPSPILYLIATPIGNLSEMSPRAIELCKEADYLAAEDTRNSGQLMKHFGIDKPFISCHEHNEKEASEKIISLLLSGKKVCYMSDAGYPGISDPGQRLVASCLEAGIKVSSVSGSSAFLNALVCSGLDTSHFYFHGFLSPKENERNHELQGLSQKSETLIFYESPHRITKTLVAMAAVLGNRKAVIARELTKAHEEFIRMPLVDLALLKEDELRGEMVIIVEGNKQEDKGLSDEEIMMAIKEELEYGRSGKEAVANVVKKNGLPKNKVYELYLKMKED